MKIKVAVVQDSPVCFNKQATLDKMEALLQGLENDPADLVLFPESFIPGYPRGLHFGTRVGSRSPEGRQQFAAFHQECFSRSGIENERLEALARKYQVYLAVGVTEQDPDSSSLFCSLLYYSPSKGYLGLHRKLKPTGSERIIWAEGDGSTLTTLDTTIGRIGGLICWENYMPLARMALYQKKVEIYLAPTADARETWVASMKHIALEGRCYVLGCNQFVTKSDYPEALRPALQEDPEVLCAGGSLIVSPMGEILAGPLWNEAGMLRAVLDLDTLPAARMDFDVVGHYARPDVFRYEALQQPETIQTHEDSDQSPE